MIKQFKKNSIVFLIAMLIAAVFVVAFASALTDTTQPTIISVSPVNNQQDLSRGKQISVAFSEAMNPLTINANTFVVTQRTTPVSGVYRSLLIDGAVTYNSIDRTATFTSNSPLTPNQEFGNVFTAMITTGATDVAGNAVSQDFVWSFTTGGDAFNTGASTSQSDQSATNNGVSVIPPVTQPPVVNTPATGAQATTASNFPWTWIVGGLLLLLLIAVIVGVAMAPSGQKEKKGTRTTRSSPFGNVHPVIDIEGIGKEHNKELHKIGIKNTKQLWEADPVKVARLTGAPLTSVKSWQNMAELASVNDIGPQYAELLERSGVHSIAQLKSSNPSKLLDAVNEKQDSLKINIQGNSPGHATVEHWIAEARDHRFTESEEQTA